MSSPVSTEPPSPSQQEWGSRLGVILAVAGSAVGLGNFLRFPGQAVQNGGGAFMIPYFAALLLLGIPIGWAEWAMARYGGSRGFHSSPGVMGVVGRGRTTRYLGVLGLVVPLIIYMYYVVIESWCLRYAVAYATASVDLGSDRSAYLQRSKDLFVRVSGSGGDGSMFHGAADPTVWFWLIVTSLNVWFVVRGLSRGIEKFCTWAMPAMAICAFVVLGRVLTLGTPDPAHPELNVLNGLGFMWNPDLSKLGRSETWLAAAGQVFFSLSVGFGVIINYASYLRRRDDIVLSGLTAVATNEFFEVGLGGLITVPAAFVFLGASGAAGGTFGLGFNTLPVVFAHMGSLGTMLGALWFLVLFLAAITSSLSMLQPVVAFVEEALGVERARAAGLTVVPAALGSLWVLYFSKDLTALDTMDFWVGTVGIFLFAAVQIVTFGWVFGIDKGLFEAHHGAALRIPKVYRFIIRYVSPAYLLAVFVGFCFQSLGGYLDAVFKNPVARYTLIWMAFIVLGLVLLTVSAERRWRKLGLDLDGSNENLEGT